MVVCLARDRTLRIPAVFGLLLVVLLLIVSVVRHPSSLGTGLLITDIALLAGYNGFLSVWVWRQKHPETTDALTAAARTGLILGVVLAASHAIEWFALFEGRTAQLVRGGGSILLMLGLLAAVGSAAWQRTRSIMLAVIAGLWCGSIATLSLLSFALSLNLAFEAHAASWLHQPFVASGMSDAGAFVVRNSLEAASEILVRMPIAACTASLIGSLLSAWITRRPRSLVVLVAWVTPSIFMAGATALWYADTLERAARPPFVMAGVLATGIALCGVHPIWSFLSRGHRGIPHEA